MKKIYTLLFSVSLTLVGFFVQAQNSNVQQQAPKWLQMMQDPEANFYETQAEFESYWQDKEITKGCGWKPFKRWEWYMEQRVKPNGERYAPDHIWKEYQKMQAKQMDSIYGSWVNLGPIQAPENSQGGNGRLNAIAFHPTDENTIYVGAPAGGLWVTHDHGQNWESNTDHLPTLGVSDIIVNYDNPQEIYLGTGDRDAGDASGIGVMKSFDGGMTWQLKNNGMGNKTVGKMIIHPDSSDILWTATSGGIYKTIDGGENWALKSPFGDKEIERKPDDPSVLYASKSGSFYRSDDGGENWTKITNGITVGGSRGVIGVSEADPNYVYFLVCGSDAFEAIYLSTDAGLSFTLKSTSPNIMDWSCDGGGSGGQAWYDLDIVVDLDNPNIIYAGGVNVWKSTDAGTSWNINAHWYGGCGVDYAHADQHVFETNSLNHRIYSGNDGGIYWTEDGTTWNDITSGLSIAQIYRIGVAQTTPDAVMNGYQDNGSSKYVGNNTFYNVLGGDGMDCTIDYTDHNYSYGEYYYGDIYRIYENGSQGQVAGNGTNGITESGNWVTPYLLHPTDPNTMYIGYKSVWRSKNVKASTWTIDWEKISSPLGTIDILVNTKSNSNILFAIDGSNIHFTENAYDDNPDWQNISSTFPSSGAINALAVHPKDENIWIVSRNHKVFRSDNKGVDWLEITDNLPDVTFSSIVFYEKANDGIYLGSDLGVFYRDKNMDEWINYSHGLPADASINELEIYYDNDSSENDLLRAATYGRGLWESPLLVSQPVANFYAEETTTVPNCPVIFHENTLGVPSSYEWHFEGGTPEISYDRQPESVFYNNSGDYDVTLIVHNIVGSDTLTLNDYIHISGTLLPEVQFTSSKHIFCSEDEKIVHFYDHSTYCPSAWLWQFTPNTVSFLENTNENSQNPVVQFNENDSYSINLKVTNSNGQSTQVFDDYVNSEGFKVPFEEDFEQGLEGKAWELDNPNNAFSWEILNTGGNLPGDKSASAQFIEFTPPYGKINRLISPPIQLEAPYYYGLSFKHAYAKRYAQALDTLRIYVSTDCGENWNFVKSVYNTEENPFITIPQVMTTPFIPQTTEDWCGEGNNSACNNINISNWCQGHENIKIMFESFYFYGNNLYIDDVKVEKAFRTENVEENEMIIYPNPTNGELYIQNKLQQKILKTELYDMQNRLIELNIPDAGLTKNYTLSYLNVGKGVYLLKIYLEDKIISKKIIIK